MRVLVLEPVYSNFHRDLAKLLDQDARALVFSWGPTVYLGGLAKTFVPKAVSNVEATASDVEMVSRCQSLYTARIQKIERSEPSPAHLSFMARYVSYLRAYLKTESIDLVIMHNDLRWQHALAISVCRELRVRYLVTERGLFRPHTTTLDMNGVNANASVGAMFVSHAFDDRLTRRPLTPAGPSSYDDLLTKAKFALFLMMETCGRLLGQCSPVNNKTFAIGDYVRLQWQQTMKGRPLLGAKHAVASDFDFGRAEGKVVFVPLQVSDDTQILVHSDFESIQNFIDAVERAFYAKARGAQLVFKLHPMEPNPSRYRFDVRSLLTRVDTVQMVQVSDCVVTINSTVGFEALMCRKPVIVLGRSFYALPGVTLKAGCGDMEVAISNVLENGWRPDDEILERFVTFVRDHYQWNFNLFSYKPKDLQELSLRLKDIIEGKYDSMLRP